MNKKNFRVLWFFVALTFILGNPGLANAVSIKENMDEVFSDSAYQYDPNGGAANHFWPVVRFDVTNDNQALGIYGVVVGADKGSYDWEDLPMGFAPAWIPANFDYENPAYLPQMNNNGSQGATWPNDGVIDWTTELIPVQKSNSGSFLNFWDVGAEAEVLFNLPDSFSGYEYVYRFETTGPFIACSGDCYRDSLPISLGDTFSFYVTGGTGSPYIFMTGNDYSNTGSLLGTFSGSGNTVVPEPISSILFLLGTAVLAGKKILPAWYRGQSSKCHT